MKRVSYCRTWITARITAYLSLLALFVLPPHLAAEPSQKAAALFSAYAAQVEARIAQQHRSTDSFLAPADNLPNPNARLQRGDIILDRIDTGNFGSAPGALLHHWRATAFARGATVKDFVRIASDFKTYPQHFAPDVTQAAVLDANPSRTRMKMRVRQHHVITVVLDGTYDVSFGELDATHGYSISRSVRIEEIADAGTPREHALPVDDEHGFLWRQNTYWSYEERDGGLYLQVESVSLTRAIPRGLGWAVRPYLESIPRESLEFTLRSARNAIRK